MIFLWTIRSLLQPLVEQIIIYRPLPIRLHNNTTNWDRFKARMQEDITLNVELKSPSDVDETSTHSAGTLEGVP